MNKGGGYITARAAGGRFVRRALAACAVFFVFAQLAAVFAQSAPADAGQNHHQWGAITLFNGLPSENVRAVAQTPDGVLWFGTQNGLARFDGRRIENVNLAGAAYREILALAADRAGKLWIGTRGGAGTLENDRFEPITETAGQPITAIFAGEPGILVSPNQVYKFSRADGEKLTVTRVAADQFYLTAAVSGVGAAGGATIYGSRGRGILVEENGGIFETASQPRPFFINALYRTRNGVLWFGADADDQSSGLFRAENPARPERVGENLGAVTAIAEGEPGELWVGTEKFGLLRFQNRNLVNRYTFSDTAGGLRSDTIFSVFVDREKVVWIGTNRGVCRFDASSPFSRTLSDKGNSNFVRALYQSSGGQLYAGTNRGLFVERAGAWVAAENLAARVVYDVSETAANQPAISTANGLYAVDGKQIMSGDARGGAVFRGKTYAAIYRRGVIEIENQAAIFSGDATTALFADDRSLWIGTAAEGVFIYDGERVRQEPELKKLSGAAIRKIFKDRENNVWFAGEAGLFRFAGGSLQTIIADQDVRGAAVSGDGDVWAATLKGGLFHLKYDADLGWLSSDINVEQGLPSEQIFSVLPLDNRLLVGTNRGVVSYAPSLVAPQIVATRVLSRRLYAADEIARPIVLEYPQNSLLLEVAGLSSRTFPEQFQYGFVLKNSVGGVITVKLSNDAQFAPADLAPGGYRIEARAFSQDLLASEPLIVEFSVARAPFPWTATALGVCLAAALIGLLWAMIERRRISARNRELAAARFNLAGEAERERKRIARDLHDQTLADLRSLMMKSDEPAADRQSFRSEIEAVSTEIRRICEDLSPSVLENVGLIAALEFLLGQTVRDYQFAAADNLEELINFSPNEQMQIYRIAQEVLNNIRRHAKAEFVRMEIAVSAARQFVLRVENDGTFFDPERAAARGRGIVNIKSRAALLRADIGWNRRESGGTIFQLTKKL